MDEKLDSGKVIGKFIGRFIVYGIIIGGISFCLENIIPQFVDWNFTSTLIIYQAVLFVISTLLIIALSVHDSIKNAKITSKQEAMQISKPIKVLLIIIALFVMIINLLYGYGIQQSGYKDADEKYKIIDGIEDPQKEELKKIEKEKVHATSSIYLAGKEIIVIFTYAYAVIYAELMITNSIVT